MASRATLKTYFETGDKPTQAQFAAFVDSVPIWIVKSSSTWTSDNTILLTGEVGVESDAEVNPKKFKIGDGTTAWNSLPYANTGSIAAGTVLANPSGVLANPVGVDAAGMRTLLSSVAYVSQTLSDAEKAIVLSNIGSGITHRPSITNTFGGGAGNATNASGGCTGFGVSCLVAAATVNDSVGIGSYALQYMTGGVGNTAVGSYALQDVVSVGNNTAVGDSALRRCLTDGSTAVGYVALSAVTTGLYNNGFGRGVLGACITGNRNCAFGNEVLASATASNNAAFGHNALYNQTTGSGNVAVGRNAGLIHVLGSNNVFIGDECAGVTGQGSDITNSIVIGRQAITPVSNSIVIGNSSHTIAQIFGTLHCHGAQNIATNQCIGYQSAPSASGGTNSTYGVSAAFSLTTGFENEAFGWQSLYSNTTGFRNVAIGNSALQSLVSGYQNTSVGRASGLLTTGIENSYFGNSAGASITTGTSNTFVGNLAGSNASQLVSAVNSTAIGNGAFTTASNQVVIGNSDVASTVLRGNVTTSGTMTCRTAVGTTPAGGGQALQIATTSGFGIYWGSGVPSAAAAQGSLYLRTDGSSTTTRMYVNTDGGTTWTAVTTAA